MHEKINLRYRSGQKELLDNDTIPFEDIRRNMQELNTINKWLGGHNITLHAPGQNLQWYYQLLLLMERWKGIHPMQVMRIGVVSFLMRTAHSFRKCYVAVLYHIKHPLKLMHQEISCQHSPIWHNA